MNIIRALILALCLASYVCCQNEEGLRILLAQDCGYFDTNAQTDAEKVIQLMSRPWLALLRIRRNGAEEFVCGGTLITNRFVLTAAHCLSKQELVLVRLGEHQISTQTDCLHSSPKCAPPVDDVLFEQIFVHEGYTKNSIENDIALIKLSRDVGNSQSIKPICLPLNRTLQQHPEEMEKFRATGWGKTGNLQSDKPTEVTVIKQNRANCQRTFRTDIKSSHICAYGSCNSDFGGPLSYPVAYNGSQRFVQFGIASNRLRQCSNTFPAVYTNVGSFIPWIAEKIANYA